MAPSIRFLSTCHFSVKSIRSTNAQQQYQLIADPEKREVNNIVKGSSGGRLSMETICDISEKILNDNPNMALQSAGSHGGLTTFNFINNAPVKMEGLGADEEFNFGFTINVINIGIIIFIAMNFNSLFNPFLCLLISHYIY